VTSKKVVSIQLETHQKLCERKKWPYLSFDDVINGLIKEEEKMKAQISKLEQEIEDMQNQTLAVEVGEHQ
tara:strand:+ start:139 stop:348 length:210 start_codon:yes stop_codon:yes gene_type:complete